MSNQYIMSSISDRLNDSHEKITESGCWIWSGGLVRGNYGAFWRNGKNVAAHRASYEEFVEKVPEGMYVLHKCDVRECINPTHLFIGTLSDNMRDCAKKKRHPTVKLTVHEVKVIKLLLKSGKPKKEIANTYGVNISSINDIEAGRSWSYINIDEETI